MLKKTPALTAFLFILLTIDSKGDPNAANPTQQADQYIGARLQNLASKSWEFTKNTSFYPTGLIVTAILITLLFLKSKHEGLYKAFYKPTKRNQWMAERLKPVMQKFNPTIYLPGPYAKAVNYIKPNPVRQKDYSRRIYSMADGEKIAVDVYPKIHNMTSSEPGVLLVYFPGLMDDSSVVFAGEFAKKVEEMGKGWTLAIINKRGFGGMPFTKGKLCSFHLFDDTNLTLKLLKRDFPKKRIFGVGSSMGGVHLQRYLTEYSDDPVIEAACSISGTWNPSKSSAYHNHNFLVCMAMIVQFKLLYRKHIGDPYFRALMKKKRIDKGKKKFRRPKKFFFESKNETFLGKSFFKKYLLEKDFYQF